MSLVWPYFNCGAAWWFPNWEGNMLAGGLANSGEDFYTYKPSGSRVGTFRALIGKPVSENQEGP